MSFIKLKSEPELKPTNVVSLQINTVSVPKKTGSYTPEKLQQQQIEIAKIEATGKDLFQPNKAKQSLQNNVRLYQSSMIYSKQLPLEKLIPLLTSNDLTLKVSALRNGTSTCMELTSGNLAELMETTADNKGDKITKLSLSDPSHGSMFVAIKEYRGKHYIQKVDYEVDNEVDKKLHI